MIEITLSDTDQRIIKWIAKMRQEANRKAGFEDKKIGDKSSLDIDIEGVAGEYAFAKAANIFPLCLTVQTGAQKRPNVDYYLFGGTWDIKTRDRPSADLLVTATKKNDKKRCDNYVLVNGKFPTYAIVGWCTAKDLFKNKYLCNPPKYNLRKPAYVLPRSELTPCDSWLRKNVTGEIDEGL